MIRKMKLKDYCLILLVVNLGGCAFFGSSSKSSKSGKSNLPKVPPKVVPGGTGSNWRYLGTSDDGQLVIEINDASITSAKIQVYNFQDRKTAVSPTTFTSYTKNQPQYKYILSSWQIDCGNKQYIIESATLYNDSGAVLQQYDYTHNSNIRWVKFGSGSIAELQYNYICLNKNRTLGY